MQRLERLNLLAPGKIREGKAAIARARLSYLTEDDSRIIAEVLDLAAVAAAKGVTQV
jgi:hypothetical protein